MRAKRSISLSLAVLLIVSLVLTSFQDVAYASNNNFGSKERVLIQYEHGTPNAEKRLKSYTSASLSRIKAKEIFVAELNTSKLNSISKDNSIECIEVDSEIHKLGDSIPWNIKAVNADSVHNNNIFGEGIKVAVFDTGIDTDNNDLVVSGGVSFVEGVQSYEDDNGHGTAMAGILASSLNNQGLVGVAPKIELYSV